jgi:hypothetical protein
MEKVYVPTGVLLEVDTVSAAVTAPVLLTVTDAGLTVQVGAAPLPPVTLHESATLPVKPFAGVTVRVAVDEPPAVTVAGFNALAVSA